MKGKGKAGDAIYPKQFVETGYAFMNRNAKGALRPQQCAESGYTFMKGKETSTETPPSEQEIQALSEWVKRFERVITLVE